jgi:light-harvesting protein B-800-850 alpha chain
MSVMNYKPLEQDYRIWLVLNPATWLVPILAAVLVIALAVHLYAFSIPGYAWTPGAEEAPAAEVPAAVVPAE